MSHNDTPEPYAQINPLFSRPGEASVYPRYEIPQESALPETAYQIVHDAAALDGDARRNLATFVTTWMDDEARRLYVQTADKNMIDKDEYPSTAEIEKRCWRMLAKLWHAPDAHSSIGTSTIGSSEACMLAGLAFKRRWQNARKAAGLDASRPNLVMSSAVQVCWEKFCNYWEVEPRFVPVSEEHPVLDGAGLSDYVDENTIGVVAILGVTYTGRFEPVEAIAAALDEIEESRGISVPLHVDAASGGMVAPFLDPELGWDFRCSRVASINTSGHKYGLVYPGIGWVVWRDASLLPSDLIFKVSYLGGDMPTFALNFSRPGAQVVLQYYMFLRLGMKGYTSVQRTSREVAQFIASGVSALGGFSLLGDGSELPVVCFRRDGTNPADKNWTLYDLSDRLRMRGWLVPTYPMPQDLEDIVVQRIVVRNGLSKDLATAFLDALRDEVEFLRSLDGPMPREKPDTTVFPHL